MADVFAAVAHHVAERGERRLHAEAEERQATFQQDDLGEGERHRHDQGRGDVRQDVQAVDACRAGAELADCGGIALFVGRQGEAAGDAGVAFPGMEAHQRDEQRQAVAEEGQHRQRDDHERHAGLEIDGHQHDLLDGLAEMRGEEAQRRAERRGDQGAEQRYQEAHADRHDEAREHVAAEFVGAQQMGPCPAHQDGRRQPRLEVERGDRIGHQEVRPQCRHDHQHQPRERQRDAQRHGEKPAAGGESLNLFGDGHGQCAAAVPRTRGSSQP